MSNLFLLLKILFLFQFISSSLKNAEDHHPSNPSYYYEILSVYANTTSSWMITCYDEDGGNLWDTNIDGALGKPKTFYDGFLLWISLSFRELVMVNDRVAARHHRQAGFWAVFSAENGRLLAIGKVTGNSDVTVKGFVSEGQSLHLVGSHGGRFFEVPMVEPSGAASTEPMVTSVRLSLVDRIGDPQPQTDNPTPPDQP